MGTLPGLVPEESVEGEAESSSSSSAALLPPTGLIEVETDSGKHHEVDLSSIRIQKAEQTTSPTNSKATSALDTSVQYYLSNIWHKVKYRVSFSLAKLVAENNAALGLVIKEAWYGSEKTGINVTSTLQSLVSSTGRLSLREPYQVLFGTSKEGRTLVIRYEVTGIPDLLTATFKNDEPVLLDLTSIRAKHGLEAVKLTKPSDAASSGSSASPSFGASAASAASASAAGSTGPSLFGFVSAFSLLGFLGNLGLLYLLVKLFVLLSFPCLFISFSLFLCVISSWLALATQSFVSTLISRLLFDLPRVLTVPFPKGHLTSASILPMPSRVELFSEQPLP
jgi:hypothetical protein